MIRPLEEKDLPRVLDLERASFSDPWSEGMIRELLLPPNLALVWEDGKVLGYIGARRAFDEGEITVAAVAPDARRQGIGRKLLAAGLQELERAGAKTVYLEARLSNEGARRLYEGAGFSPVGVRKRYYESPPEDAVIYRKELTHENTGI